jgi:restriction system protein
MALEDYPDHADVRSALLLALFQHGGPTYALTPQQAYRIVADEFGLTEEQRRRLRPNTDDPAWHHRLQWARRRLLELGLMSAPQKSTWALTDAGRAAAAKLAASID